MSYNLPSKVIFCKKCVMSNQRPSSVPEFKHLLNKPKPTLQFKDGVCDGCRYGEEKEKIDWKAREKEFIKLCDKHRRKSYDVIVPGSGGKDSVRAAHILKNYGMHPLTVTWPPHIYTDIGLRNFHTWTKYFDNITFKPKSRVHALLTKVATENLFHPFQPFILGQKNFPPKIAQKYGIDLIFYGENEAELGNPIGENSTALRDIKYYTIEEQDSIYLGGVSLKDLLTHYDLDYSDIDIYLPMELREKPEVRYLGYYFKWNSRESYRFALKYGFETGERTEGTYTNSASLDDRIDGLNYWGLLIKFGLGRATYDASGDIMEGYLTRQQGIEFVKLYDQEFPNKYFDECLDYMGMTKDKFFSLEKKFKPKHLWRGRKLLHTV